MNIDIDTIENDYFRYKAMADDSNFTVPSEFKELGNLLMYKRIQNRYKDMDMDAEIERLHRACEDFMIGVIDLP